MTTRTLTVIVLLAAAASTGCTPGTPHAETPTSETKTSEAAIPSAATIVKSVQRTISESVNVTVQAPMKDGGQDIDAKFKLYRGRADVDATLSFKDGSLVHIIVGPSNTLIKGNAAYYKLSMKQLSDRRFDAAMKSAADKWIALPTEAGQTTGTTSYDAMLRDLKLDDVNLLTNVLTQVDKAQLDGKDVYKLSDKAGRKDVLYVTADEKFLPLQYHAPEGFSSITSPTVLTFTNWNSTDAVTRVDPKDIVQ